VSLTYKTLRLRAEDYLLLRNWADKNLPRRGTLSDAVRALVELSSKTRVTH